MRKIVILNVFFLSFLFSKGIEIEANINKDFSSNYIAMIEFKLKNNTEDWQTLKDIKVEFTKGNEFIEVLDNKKLSIWSEFAKERENELKASSKLWATFWFGAIGTIYSSATILEEENDLSKQVKTLNKFPKTHLYGADITIPPGLYSSKFLIVSSKQHKKYGYVNKLKVTYFLSSKSYTEELTFRSTQFNEDAGEDMMGDIPKNNYIWQSDL